MTPGRIALVVVGALVSAYGAWLLLSRTGLDSVPEVATWFLAGVVLHDFVLVPLALAVGVLLARLVPATLRTPLTVGLVVLGLSLIHI